MTIGPGRTGLVAPNGTGKSTLLRLAAGLLKPTRGSVSVTGHLGYLPQDVPLRAGMSVDEVLGIAPVRRALAAIEAGDAAPDHFAAVGDNWDAEERGRATLDRLGLRRITLEPRYRITVRRRGDAGGPVGLAARPARRAAARRTDQQP